MVEAERAFIYRSSQKPYYSKGAISITGSEKTLPKNASGKYRPLQYAQPGYTH
jgi:hypothetical protein